MKFGQLKIGLSLSAISLAVGCGGLNLPPAPAVYQCQYNGTPRAFYCVNTRTSERLKIDAEAVEMKAAQCVSADDYKKLEAWRVQLIQFAQRECASSSGGAL